MTIPINPSDAGATFSLKLIYPSPGSAYLVEPMVPASLPNLSLASNLDHATTPITSATTSTALQTTTAILTSILPLLSPNLSTRTLLVLSSTSTMPSATGSPRDEKKNTGSCELLGSFAILVQAALGGLALLSLVFKRWRERPQRPVKIWAFDASKQVFGSVLLHLANLVMSMFSAGEIHGSVAEIAANAVGKGPDSEKFQPNPCSFYLLNLAIDTTIGIPILIIMLRLLHAVARLTPLANPPESIQSGNYGQPPRATWWLKQSLVYFIGLLCMKFCVFVVFELCPWIVVVGDWALRWTEGNEAIQVAFVMLIFPLIMNALQYYIIDSFIKKKEPASKEDAGQEQGRDLHNEEARLLAAEEEPAVLKVSEQDKQRREDGKETIKPDGHEAPGREPYDPNTDDEVVTSRGGSSSSADSAQEEALAHKPPV